MRSSQTAGAEERKGEEEDSGRRGEEGGEEEEGVTPPRLRIDAAAVSGRRLHHICCLSRQPRPSPSPD
jgi:hypothetical protein